MRATWESSEKVVKAAFQLTPDPGFPCATSLDPSGAKGVLSCQGLLRGGTDYTATLSLTLGRDTFRYDQKFENAGILYDGSDEKRINYTLEGGDVHPIRPDLLVLGFSERSSPAALDLLCELVFANCRVTDVIIVVLPAERTAIHLDMIFTQVDRELCIVYPPHFVGPERLAVLHRRKRSKGVKEVPNFFAAMQPYSCTVRLRLVTVPSVSPLLVS